MKKEMWIEKLRVYATFAVVMQHVIGSSYAGYTSSVPTYRSFFDLSLLFSIIKPAVPLFIMISGYLLLDPQRGLGLAKLKSYIARMLLVLSTFGLGFCFIENVLKYKDYGLFYIIKQSVYNLITGSSWDHMWYIYMLIGLYILTPLLRAFTKIASVEEYRVVLLCLFVLAIVIPTINTLFALDITSFNLSGLTYVFYYLFGYYIKIPSSKKIANNQLIIVSIASYALLVVLSFKNLSTTNSAFDLNNIFLAVLSIGIFSLMHEKNNCKHEGCIKYISKRSFYVYLIHPFFLNVLCKAFSIYILQFPIVAGEMMFFAIALVLSLATYEIVSRLPIFRRIV